MDENFKYTAQQKSENNSLTHECRCCLKLSGDMYMKKTCTFCETSHRFCQVSSDYALKNNVLQGQFPNKYPYSLGVGRE